MLGLQHRNFRRDTIQPITRCCSSVVQSCLTLPQNFKELSVDTGSPPLLSSTQSAAISHSLPLLPNYSSRGHPVSSTSLQIMVTFLLSLASKPHLAQWDDTLHVDISSCLGFHRFPLDLLFPLQTC